jgi:hypothetical protein
MISQFVERIQPARRPQRFPLGPGVRRRWVTPMDGEAAAYGPAAYQLGALTARGAIMMPPGAMSPAAAGSLSDYA